MALSLVSGTPITLAVLSLSPVSAPECWQCRYRLPDSGAVACATLWRWPGGRTRVRLVTLGQVRESRQLRNLWDIAVFLGMAPIVATEVWQRLG